MRVTTMTMPMPSWQIPLATRVGTSARLAKTSQPILQLLSWFGSASFKNRGSDGSLGDGEIVHGIVLVGAS